MAAVEHTVEYQDPNTEIHGTAHYVKYKRSFPDAAERNSIAVELFRRADSFDYGKAAGKPHMHLN